MTAFISGRLGRASFLFAIAGSILALPQVACGQQKSGEPRLVIDSVTSAQFRAYLHTLRFVPDTEAGDRQALLVGHYPDSARYGPLAMILPEEESYEGSDEDLEHGKVIARISNESADSYPKLGLLPHAVTYWWVEYDADRHRGRSVFIAVDADTNIIGRTVRGLEVIRDHKWFRVSQSLARFVWTSDDEFVWGSCSGHCCRSTS
jgi:hypothetical protein